MNHADRGTGRTTKQMLDAPQGAIFISGNRAMTTYDTHLSQKHGRADLKVVAPYWLTELRWQGMTLTGIVVDHAARLSEAEKHALVSALTRVGR